MMVCDIAADEDATEGCRRDRETEEIGVGKRRKELEEFAVGRSDGDGGGGDMSGGRRARLLARMGVGRRSDGLRTIALVPAASRVGYGGILVALLIPNPFIFTNPCGRNWSPPPPPPPPPAPCRNLSISCMPATIRTNSSTINLNSLLRRSIPPISLRILANMSSIWDWVSSSSSLNRMYRRHSSRWIRRVISPGLMRSRNA
jgi:hypothetical protein